MRKTLTLILSLLVTGILMAQPKQEIRAVWLTTNPNAVDWPKSTKEA